MGGGIGVNSNFSRVGFSHRRHGTISVRELEFSLLLNFPTLQTSHDFEIEQKQYDLFLFLKVFLALALVKTFSSPRLLNFSEASMHFHSQNACNPTSPASMQPARTRYTCKTEFWRFLLVCFSLFLFLRRASVP